MVIKTETCFYSETKIYPGHGTQFVRKDGKLLHFQNSKNASLYHQGIKAMRLTWTMAWRRLNKKVRVDIVSKRRAKRKVRIQKPVAGQSLEDLRKKRAARPILRNLAKEAQAREVKERKKTAASKPAGKAAASRPQQPKMKFSKKGTR
ncbi:TRASH domain-containing protein [Plasmodiophora brassicae]|uniref:Large ribosomal subunit protein eL24-related N-terminal domain-containing protein n=1 Tax=Plasmodiophora brassicae TaxID=37360 RepID=A0A0G4J4Q1_PLABS|nr:hypothetical protein PBRA_002501 [Plasmodiophora brassicae]SPQ93585.1 unnamed protein product [Plasmodiophora brassicae]